MGRCPDFLSLRMLLSHARAAAAAGGGTRCCGGNGLPQVGCAFFWPASAFDGYEVPIFISSCSSTVTTAQRHTWLRWPRPMSERSNLRSWTHFPRAPVMTHPLRAYSTSKNPTFVSHFRFGHSFESGCGGASISLPQHNTTSDSRG